MAVAEPWQRAEVPGTKKALLLPKPQVLTGLVRKTKKRIMIVGSETFTFGIAEKELIECIRRFTQNEGIHVHASANTIRRFLENGFEPESFGPVFEIANRLQDSNWKGLDGEGNYDIALLIGLPYYMGWLILSGLRNFATDLVTVSLDPYYQPNANWSLPNQSRENWIRFIKDLATSTTG
ncbi:MAG: CO dehydrogenase/acetyl-CoA synthase complex subunit epsilon [Candidatus Bathyarchaeia archaeon]